MTGHRASPFYIAIALGLCLAWLVSCSSTNSHPAHLVSPATSPGVLETTILTPDGQRAAGATAVLVPPGHQADVTDGQTIDDDPAYQRATLGADGRLPFTSTTQPCLVVVIHPTGYAQFDYPPVAQVRLQPWGRIEGRYLVGDKPDTGEKVITWTTRPEEYDPRGASATFIARATADQQGRFVLPRVPSGEAALALDRTFHWGSIDRPMQELQVPPGGVATVTMGGGGRPVVGRIALPPALAAQKDWECRVCM